MYIVKFSFSYKIYRIFFVSKSIGSIVKIFKASTFYPLERFWGLENFNSN